MAEKKTGASTKDFVQIADIRESVIILKNGTRRSVVEVSSINFELKSSDEQAGLIQAFQSFLNSVDFPLQIVLNSRRIDVRPYLKSLEDLQQSAASELLRIQIVEYGKFVKGLTDLANIMTKKFFICIPFAAIESANAGERGKGLLDSFKGLFGSNHNAPANITDTQLESYKIQLNQRVDVISSGLSGMGIDVHLLKGDELAKIFYSYYNPGHVL